MHKKPNKAPEPTTTAVTPPAGAGVAPAASWLIFDVRQKKSTCMTEINLAGIPYPHRFNGASLLISKANRLADSASGAGKTRQKQLLAAVAYFDMALLLMKRYDPNYATVVNWKCNALLKLEQYEEAVRWYRVIVSISDETDGRAGRNATAKLAEEMITKYSGTKNNALQGDGGIDSSFDEPPYCMHAEDFCSLLAERKFKKAHSYLAPMLREEFPVQGLKEAWSSMIGAAQSESLSVSLQRHILDWPSRKKGEIGWCYFSVSAEGMSEGLSLVVARTPYNGYWLTELKFGRP